MDAKAEGFVDGPSGKFGADVNGKVQLCITIVKEVCASAGADVAMSNTGFAACAEFLGESAGWSPRGTTSTQSSSSTRSSPRRRSYDSFSWAGNEKMQGALKQPA